MFLPDWFIYFLVSLKWALFILPPLLIAGVVYLVCRWWKGRHHAVRPKLERPT